MIDSLTAKIKRYPFQTGIIVGFILCLLFVGFVNLFKDNGRTLSGNQEIIQEDYLRMTIMEFGENRDSQLAGWRYAHLGSSADETLRLMKADETISPQLLAAFADAVGKINILSENASGGANSSGTPSSPRKGLSGFGKALLVILLLVVLCAGGLYVASLQKTRKKQKRRSEVTRKIEDEPLNVVNPAPERKTSAASVPAAPENVKDTLFDLDGLFPKEEKNTAEPVPQTEKKFDLDIDEPETPDEKNIPDQDEDEDEPIRPYSDLIEDEPEESPDETVPEEDEDELPGTFSDETEDLLLEEETAEDVDEPVADNDTPEEPVLFDLSDEKGSDADIHEPASEKVDEGRTEKKSLLDYEAEKFVINEKMGSDPLDDEDEPESTEEPESSEEPESIEEPVSTEDQTPSNDPDAEKPLVETDTASDPDSEDELLKMIRSPKNSPLELQDESFDLPADLSDEALAANESPSEPVILYSDNKVTPILPDDEELEEENLIHYQSTYKIGNDMYDEVFSIDQGDTFRGECGISIGETLNNTEPKAVTAFELWLFDKDDIHTATWYLLSDFALTNEGLSKRLSQKGNCERIRKGASYVLETATLRVEAKVIDLEYGTEMEEKNSYFTNVTFDVTARSKKTENAED